MQDFVFLGVSTGHSLVHRHFDSWCEILREKVRLVGYDIPIGADCEAYNDFLTKCIFTSNVVGALVTSHKAALFECCEARFSNMTERAQYSEEIGVIFRVREGWTGDAPDIQSTRFVVVKLLATQQWRTGDREVVIFGAGGAGLALTIALAQLDLPPKKITLTEIREERLLTARRVLRRYRIDELVQVTSATYNQQIVNEASRGTLFVNASGLGKDLPGSPINSFGAAKTGFLAWDFNYRGDLQFLEQARAELIKKNAVVEDGWDYFISGWAHTMCRVFGHECTEHVVSRFADVARPQVC